MTPDDVKGTKPTRWWRVRDVDDPANKLDLEDGDLLVFDAAALKMIRIRPTSPPASRVNAVESWGVGCVVTRPSPGDAFALKISGTLKTAGGSPFSIEFFPGGGRARHKGGTPGPSAVREIVPAGTWEADEGP